MRTRRGARDERTRLLARLVVGLRAFAAADYALAASVFDGIVARVSELGGSHAQNLLFGDIGDYCWQHADQRAAA
jgi:hypothetical protein